MSNVTRKELAVAVHDQLGISQRNSSDIVDSVFSVLKDTLVNGESVKLVQFGTLTVRDKSPRKGRNPRTGEAVHVEEKRVPFFRTGKELRERLNASPTDGQ